METVTTSNVREMHVEKINDAIDAILDLEACYSSMPSDLSRALKRLNELRNLAEEEIEVGDKVWDSFNGKVRTVKFVQVKNFCFEDGDLETRTVGKKFCFKVHY